MCSKKIYPKKIAILLPDLRGGGAERMRVNLTNEWLSAGFLVDFVLMRAQGELLSLTPQKVEVFELGVDRIITSLIPLINYLRKSKPDVLLAAMWPLTVVAILAAKLTRYRGRIIVSDHVALSNSPQAATWLRKIILSGSIGLVYRFAHVRVAVSAGVADDLAMLSGISRKQFKVIYNPATVTNRIRSVQASVPEGNCEKLIISVGSLKRQKDHSSLIKAFSLTSAKKHAHLLILGEGDERSKLEKLVDDLGLQKRVHLPGFMLNLAPYYAAADLFVLSSQWEGFANVIVEALQWGVPVISTNCPCGPAEILENGVYGDLVPVGDIEALARAIDQALSREYDKQALIRRAADFSADRIAKQYLDLMFPRGDQNIEY